MERQNNFTIKLDTSSKANANSSALQSHLWRAVEAKIVERVHKENLGRSTMKSVGRTNISDIIINVTAIDSVSSTVYDYVPCQYYSM